MWKCYNLKEGLTPLPNMFQGNGTLKQGVADTFGDFLGACSVCGGMTIEFFRKFAMHCTYYEISNLDQKGFLVLVCGIMTYQKLRL